MKQQKILIVDDEANIRDLMNEALCDEYDISTAENGAAALEQIKSGGFDLVLCDLDMPVMNGFQFLDAMKKTAPHIPVIVLSAYAMSEPALKAIKKGAIDFLDKPIHLDFLSMAIKKGLKRRMLDKKKQKVLQYLIQELHFTIPNKNDYFPAVIDKVIHAVQEVAASDTQLIELQYVLIEALNNAYQHGNNADPNKHIVIDVIISNDAVSVTVRDSGNGFDTQQFLTQIDKDIHSVQGRGILLMKLNSDEITYNAAGNEVTLRKHIIIHE